MGILTDNLATAIALPSAFLGVHQPGSSPEHRNVDPLIRKNPLLTKV